MTIPVPQATPQNRSRRVVLPLTVLSALGLLPIAASAQTLRQFTPASTGAQNYNVPANWIGGNVPDDNTETAAFGIASTVGSRLLNSSTYTVNQDVAGLNLGGLNVLLSGPTAAFTSGGTSGANTIVLASVANMRVGDSLTGTGVPAGTTITAIGVGSANEVTLSNALTAQAAGTFTNSNFGTALSLSGNAIEFSRAAGNAVSLNSGNAGAGNTIAIANNLVLTTATTFTSVGAGVTLSGALSGAGALTTGGIGTSVTFGGTGSTFTGALNVGGGGTTRIATATALGDPSAITLGSGNTVFGLGIGSGNAATFGGSLLTGGNTATTAGGTNAIVLDTGATATFSSNVVNGRITGLPLRLQSANTAGTSVFSLTGTALNSTGNFLVERSVAAGTSLSVLSFDNASGTQTFNGFLQAGTGGSLRRNAAGGTTVLNEAVVGSGAVAVNGGTLVVKGGDPAGSATFASGGASGTNNLVVANAASIVVGSNLTGTGAAAFQVVAVNLATNTVTLASNLTAAAAGTYTSSATSGTGTGAVTVGSGGVLTGTGLSQSALTINAGGRISAGDPTAATTTGTLTTSGMLTLTSGATAAFELGGTAAGTFDTLSIGGNLVVGTGVNLEIDVLTGATLAVGNTFNLIAYGGTDPANAFNAPTFVDAGYAGTFAVDAANNLGILTITAVPIPEPATYAMVLGGLGLLVGAQRRSRRLHA